MPRQMIGACRWAADPEPARCRGTVLPWYELAFHRSISPPWPAEWFGRWWLMALVTLSTTSDERQHCHGASSLAADHVDLDSPPV
jgi:hypothetical protein